MIYNLRYIVGSIVCLLLLQSCGGSSSSTPSGVSPQINSSSNRARVVYDCDLNGANGVLTVDIEVVGATGLVFGSGSNPDITGVIGTGENIYYTSGTLISATAYYTFTGENSFADFTEQNTFARFRVQWVLTNEGMTVIVNPFGTQPTQVFCRLNSTMYL